MFRLIASEESWPAAMLVILMNLVVRDAAETGTGTELFAVVPLPSSPPAL